MINLIKNEYIKVFSKKSIYITVLVLAAFALLINFVLNVFNEGFIHYRLEETSFAYEIEEAENIIEKQKDDEEHKNEYYESKAVLELNRLIENYKKDSWQAYVLAEDYFDAELAPLFMIINKADEDSKKLKEAESLYLAKLQLLDGSWQDFYKAKNESLEKELLLPDLDEKSKDLLNLQIDLNNKLIKQEIYPKQDYLNAAASAYLNGKTTLLFADENSSSKKHKLSELQINEIEEEIAINEYIIDNKVDANNGFNNNAVIQNLASNYGIFFLILMILVSGSIVSDEMSKGTIKFLLVKPYKRWKILLSKYVVSLSFVFLSFFAIAGIQALAGGIFGDFASLSNEVVSYSYKTKEIITSNLFVYSFSQYLYQIPQYIIMTTLAFAISTIFGSTSLAMVFGIGGSFVASIINVIIMFNPKKIFMYLPTMNWDLAVYRFGKASTIYPDLTFNKSLIISLIYWLILVILSFAIFNKKDIKNI